LEITIESGKNNQFTLPIAVAVDGDDNLWVGDTDNYRIMMFPNAQSSPNNPTATIIFGKYKLRGCTAYTNTGIFSLTTDPVSNTLWADDNYCNRILVFTSANAKSSGDNADFAIGATSPKVKGVSGCSQNQFGLTQGVYFDSSTNSLFVSDQGNNRVVVFENALPPVNNPSATYQIGQPNLQTCFGRVLPTNSTTMTQPEGLVYDPTSSTLWVADYYNNRVNHIGCNLSSEESFTIDHSW